MTHREESLYTTFKTILELSQPALRLEQFGLEPDQISELQERHNQLNLLRSPEISLGPIATWYTGPRARDIFWPALTEQLASDTYNARSLTSLDDTSTRVVAHLHHPQEPTFATRGLVLTHPQAGNTTNIAAVIAKAADRGYRMFIVLTGLHNAMRTQLQERLDQLLVAPHRSRWQQLTTLEKDFQPTPVTPGIFRDGSSACGLAVIKKNSRVLQKVDNWLAHFSDLLHECPTLVIDTEFNLPSVASNSITPRVQSFLHKMPRAGYLGYTTTALNGLLIEPGTEELFPKDFIISLPPPESYAGPEVLFGREPRDGDLEQTDDGHDMIRLIPDEDAQRLRPQSRAAAETFRLEVPPTLRDALEYFWLVAAARTVRGSGTPHNTMLIHAGPYSAVQAEFLTRLTDMCAESLKQLSSTSYVTHLRQVWEHEMKRVSAREFGLREVSFDDLLPHLHSIVHKCGITGDRHNDDDALHPIPETTVVVGGGTPLGRGRELDGVSVAYFGSTTSSAYETLRQAERWFGLRAGYADLPRVWITEELSIWWRELARADNEMRFLADRAFEELTTPMDLAVRVRRHPQAQVVRAAKGGSYLPSISYGGRRVQTHRFRTNAEWLRINMEAARTLVATSATFATRIQEEAALGRYIFHDVPSGAVIDFLGAYQFHEETSGDMPRLLIDYIRKRMRVADSLSRWNIAILGKPAENDEANFTFFEGVTVGRVIRSRLRMPSGAPQDFADIKTLMSRLDAAVDLNIDTAKLYENEIRRARQEQLPHTGLLALYPIDKTSSSPLDRKSRAPLNAEEHVIGVGIVFPEPQGMDSMV
ncbi:Z1 domain-containing protein [Streptomyces sp. NPDC102467]|uniref:Z1 domain-containing protein n=1 Tax=Streptomyces sp. NPDC102467 TaxID=3366179 RepID=UPI00381BB5FF